MRQRIQRRLRISPDEHIAHIIGMTLFIVAIAIMTGVDRFHHGQRERIPSSITSVLFFEPLEKYTAMQADIDSIASNIGEARAKVEHLAKSIARCGWHDIIGDNSVEQCGFADMLHMIKDELVNYRFRTPGRVDKEIDQLCTDISSLRTDLDKHTNDPDFVSCVIEKLVREREDHALVHWSFLRS